MERKAEVTKIGGSWSSKGCYREMCFLDMINWMNKYDYKLAWARDRKDGRRNMIFRKAGCRTEYHVVC